MTVYFITIILVFIFAIMASFLGKHKIKNNQYYTVKNRVFVFLITASLTLVSGLRWRVGTDYWQYSINYERYVDQVWNDLLYYNEPGIKLISWISSIIYDDYATMFFISSVITVTLFVSTISKYSNYFLLSILLFIFIGVWHGSFNGVRQYLACAVIFAGHRYIVDRKFLKYLLVVLIAGSFHVSALSMLLLYSVPKVKLKINQILVLGLLSIVFVYTYDFLFEFIGSYIKESFSINEYVLREVSLLRVLVSFAPLVLFYTLTNRQGLSSEDYFYINLLFVNAAIALATSQSAYLARFALYTNTFTILGLPRLINMKDKYLRSLIQFITVILFLLFWYADVSKSPVLYNFQWIFERSK